MFSKLKDVFSCVKLVHSNIVRATLASKQMTSMRKSNLIAVLHRQFFIALKFGLKNVQHFDFVRESNNQMEPTRVES